MREIARGSHYSAGMSDPKRDRDSDRDSLTGWTLVDREGTPEDTASDGPQQEDDEDGAESSVNPEGAGAEVEDEEEEDAEDESGCGMEEDEEGGEEEALPDDLVSMGQRVQEIKGESIKASSGSDSSDIETLECPDPGEFYEDHALAYSSMNSSLFSSSIRSFTFVGGSEEGDVESIASTDSILDAEKEKLADEETDLSLASSPSLPDDLPAIKPDTQYKHIPDKDLNSRLNIVVALTLACVLGLGIGHFLGWSSRSVWQESMNSAQVRRLRELQDDLVSCMNMPLQASSHPDPDFLVDSSPPIMDKFQAEMDSDNPDYQSGSFIPVLADGNGDGLLNVESLVEPLVMPLEDTGVVLNPNRKAGMSFLHGKVESPKPTDPAFVDPNLIHNKPNFVSDLHMKPVKEMPEMLHEIPETYPMTNTPAVDAELSTQLPLSSDNVEALFEIEEKESTSQSIPLPSGCASPNLPEDLSSSVEEDLSSELSSSVGVEALQILDAMNLENEELESEIIRLQRENIAPIKIRGKDGKYARSLRERINHLIVDNEELRMAVGKLQFANFPDSDTNAFNSALEKNYNLRLAAGKLIHLGPELNALKESANDLQAENQELKIQVGKLRYQQQPLPQELNAVAREIEKLKKTIEEASQKKNVPPNLNNAKTYVSYMSQILSAIHTLHEFEEGSLAEKIDVATDVFEDLAPENIKLNSQTRQKLNAARSKFSQIQASLSRKWEKLKELSQPEKLAAVSRDTHSKMNRVIINVVNKVKEIGRTNILRRGKASLEKTISTLAEQLAALGLQFDKTWKDLEGDVVEVSDKDLDVAAKSEDKIMRVAEAVVVTEEAAATHTEVEKQLLMDKEDVEDETAKKKLPAEVKPEDEVVITAKAKRESVGVKQAGKKHAQVKEIVSKQFSTTAAKPQKGREGRRGGGGDKKKLPDDKKEQEIKKVKEKVEEKKPVEKRRRSRRSRVSEKEEKKEKNEKKSTENESNEKQKIDNKQKKNRENGKWKDKQNGRSNRNDKSRNYHQRNEKDSKIQGKEEPQRYYKGQYNKYDKKYHHHHHDDDDDDDDDGHSYKRKQYKEKHHDDDDDDDDDDHYKKRRYAKYSDDDDSNDRKKGLMRHWQKPPKKNYHREYSGPKKTFIRRRGKNDTQHYNGEWSIRRATGREYKRREEQKSDWLFERAKDRRNMRENEQKADWQFNRAQGRKDMRFHDDYQPDRFQDYDRYGHARYEKRETRRRYVRFDDDEDDDDDEYYYHKRQEKRGGHGRHEYNKGKGQREWVIPNFSATGKTYYR